MTIKTEAQKRAYYKQAASELAKAVADAYAQGKLQLTELVCNYIELDPYYYDCNNAIEPRTITAKELQKKEEELLKEYASDTDYTLPDCWLEFGITCTAYEEYENARADYEHSKTVRHAFMFAIDRAKMLDNLINQKQEQIAALQNELTDLQKRLADEQEGIKKYGYEYAQLQDATETR